MDIQWKDEFALGIGIIDDQHKKLIERAAAFSRQDLTDLRDFLVRWVLDHIMQKDRDIIRCLPLVQETDKK